MQLYNNQLVLPQKTESNNININKYYYGGTKKGTETLMYKKKKI